MDPALSRRALFRALPPRPAHPPAAVPSTRDTLTCQGSLLGNASLVQLDIANPYDAALVDLVQALSDQAPRGEARRSGRPHPAARRARDALAANLAGDIGLADLADAAGADRFRLTRLFREAYGRSPHAYLVQLRLKAARRALAAGESPARAAADCGFADQSHLGRWFRRAYGLTPAAYRRICTNLPD